jgi:hypothetical protein
MTAGRGAARSGRVIYGDSGPLLGRVALTISQIVLAQRPHCGACPNPR